MPQPPSIEPSATRIFAEYAAGADRFVPPVTVGVQAPAQQISNPFDNDLWSEVYSFAYTTTGSVASGATLTITQQIPLTDIPPVQVPSTSVLRVESVPWVDHQVTGLVLQGISSTGVVATGAIQFQGQTFNGGQTYSGWAVKVTARLFNATAGVIASGQSLTLYVFVLVVYH